MSPEPIAKQRCSRESFFGSLIIPFLPKASRCWGASSTTFSIRSRPRLPVILSPRLRSREWVGAIRDNLIQRSVRNDLHRERHLIAVVHAALRPFMSQRFGARSRGSYRDVGLAAESGQFIGPRSNRINCRPGLPAQRSEKWGARGQWAHLAEN